ncbi:MAG TPA: hypothetical protein VI248_26285 [Kineosporiaceae bacterium]
MSGPDPSPDALVRARTSVHGLAEHVFAVAARAATRSIRLYVHDGALSTPDLPGAGTGDPTTRLELRDGVVARRPGGPELPFAGPLGDLAAALGVPFGLTDPPYRPASGCGPEHLVDADAAAVERVLEAWRVGDAALRRFDPAQTPIVWPEHLDVAIVADAINYGVSPGDGFEPWPYAYVGPHRARTGPFWNAPFGAARRLAELDGVEGVVAFFTAGRTAALTDG